MKPKEIAWITASVSALLVVVLIGYGCQNFYLGLLESRLGPTVPKQNRDVSDALLMGQPQTLSNIEEITFVDLSNSQFRANWLYDYIGFPKAVLTQAEKQELLTALKDLHPVREPEASPGKPVDLNLYYNLMGDYDIADRDARHKAKSWALLFKMRDGQLGFLSVSETNPTCHLTSKMSDNHVVTEMTDSPHTSTFFQAKYDKARLCAKLDRSIPAILAAASRARVQPISILFPLLNDQQADMIARRWFPDDYDKCKSYILNLPEIKETFGNHPRLRLAQSDNSGGGFPDYGVTLTFRISGNDKEGAIKISWTNGNSPVYCQYISGGKLYDVGLPRDREEQPNSQLAQSCNEQLNEIDKERNKELETLASSIRHKGYVGMQLQNNIIHSVFPHLPAAKAGLKSGDKIITVDNKLTNSLSMNQIVQMLTGPIGTKVTVGFQRQGEYHTAVLTRAKPSDEEYKLLIEEKQKGRAQFDSSLLSAPSSDHTHQSVIHDKVPANNSAK